ncbi:hypothetical protein [Paenibacillus sp. SI8]|uniref:hypothetical protein n=1 Tax=unclassified Paenibacillus TaxID=185978 RepID=UPI003466F179
MDAEVLVKEGGRRRRLAGARLRGIEVQRFNPRTAVIKLSRKCLRVSTDKTPERHRIAAYTNEGITTWSGLKREQTVFRGQVSGCDPSARA